MSNKMSERHYLDYNATAPLRPQVRAAMLDALESGGANPSSVHAEGRHARALIEKARHSICEFVAGDADGLIFTSSGTEACNLALQTHLAPAGKIGRILVSAIEHPAILQTAATSELPVLQLGVDSSGQIDLTALDSALQDPTPALVAIMAANNETGAIQPIAEIGKMVRAHGSVFLCDGVQALGKMPLNMQTMHIDMLALSAHKIGGAAGSGALLIAPHIEIKPLIYGGGQELRRRAGTENLLGIVGFGAAIECAAQDLLTIDALAVLRDKMEAQLEKEMNRQKLAPLHFFARDIERLPNTSCFAIAGLSSETLVMALDLEGIAVSAGAACSSGKVTASHVLTAMGVADDLVQGAIRVSLGWDSKPADIDNLVACLTAFVVRQNQTYKDSQLIKAAE
ncbi:MAG: cysteine desulfurase family protein [Alphaproteobacteria bacterium]|nr:cysteine desulfurase family protein [Alphaproteobacteria bacterium]